MINAPCTELNWVLHPLISTITGILLKKHANPSRNLATDANERLRILYSNKRNRNSLDRQESNKTISKRTRVYSARKETSVELVTSTCVLDASVVNGNRFRNNLQNENLRAIKKQPSTNFYVAHIPTSPSKPTTVLNCYIDQQLSTSKGSIIYTPYLINLQFPHTIRYDFISSPTEVIPFRVSILEIYNLPTKYMLDHNNKIVTVTTANLEKKDFMPSSSRFACNKYFIYLQRANMNFKVITKDLLYLDLKFYSLAAVSSSGTTMIIISKSTSRLNEL